MKKIFVFALLISFYAIFTWKFYKSLSKKDLVELNLSQYNRTLHPFLNKFFAVIFYIVEYIVILPFLIFFWFAVLALLILMLSNELAITQVIIVAAAITLPLGLTTSHEYAELEWPIDIAITLIWVVFGINMFWQRQLN